MVEKMKKKIQKRMIKMMIKKKSKSKVLKIINFINKRPKVEEKMN